MLLFKRFFERFSRDSAIIDYEETFGGPAKLAATQAEAETLADSDHASVVGRRLKVKSVYAYWDAGEGDITAPEGRHFLVRITKTERSAIHHWNDDFIDPYWDVVILEGHDLLPVGSRNPWIDGRSWEVAKPEKARA